MLVRLLTTQHQCSIPKAPCGLSTSNHHSELACTHVDVLAHSFISVQGSYHLCYCAIKENGNMTVQCTHIKLKIRLIHQMVMGAEFPNNAVQNISLPK